MSAAQMEWTGDDTWILAIGAVAGAAAALPGCQLVLTRQSMFPEAIGHGVLPGLVLGAVLAGVDGSAFAPLPLLLGALVAAALAAALVEGLRRGLGVETGAALGIAATSLFALGQILLRGLAPGLNLDPHTVLFGSLVLAPLDPVQWLGVTTPRAFATLLLVAVLNGTAWLALKKELVLGGFDPQGATLSGVPAGLIRALVMMLTALTAVAAFQAVGAILVVALMVAPPLSARMWTRRVEHMVPLAMLLGALAAAAGHGLAASAAVWLPVAGIADLHTAGCGAVLAGAVAVLAVITRRGG